jgi:hypothetical protein
MKVYRVLMGCFDMSEEEMILTLFPTKYKTFAKAKKAILSDAEEYKEGCGYGSIEEYDGGDEYTVDYGGTEHIHYRIIEEEA